MNPQQPDTPSKPCARRAAGLRRTPRAHRSASPWNDAADAAETRLSDLEWVRLWAQVYRAEADAVFNTSGQ